MKMQLKMIYIFSILTCGFTTNIKCNAMIADNKTAYQIAADIARNYLSYSPAGGATNSECSPNGKTICLLLGNLHTQAKSFTNPEREDLKKLSLTTKNAFRNFDFSGNMQDRKIFINELGSLLTATRSLLEEKDIKECNLLIQKIRATTLQ